MMIRIKKQPEDFIVTEKLIDGFFTDDPTNTHVYLLEKRNYTTERAVTHLAKALNIPRKNISYAGTKDKVAITRQYITIKGASREKVANIKLKDISLDFRGYAEEPLRLGSLEGNSFEILVKGLPVGYEVPFKKLQGLPVPNYFDKQRFSTANIDIGKAIIQKDFKKAVEIITDKDGDWKDKLHSHLEKQQNDYVGALKLIPRKTLLFYVHALQSKVFNELLASEVKNRFEIVHELEYDFGTLVFPELQKLFQVRDTSLKLPLLGYDSNPTREQEETLVKQELTTKDFLIRQIPELSLEGSSRFSFITATDIKLEELNTGDETGSKAIKAKFYLPKGAYATITLKTILSRILATEQSDL
ncbi:MAG: tRNA pseudouridine(13) synthase TruD [Candidatus Woesearchaeota archaeon]